MQLLALNNRLISLLFCIFAILYSCLYSRLTFANETFKRIGVDDGLPNATVYSITQDHQGYIWLSSTNSGLLRYDGFVFKEFPVLTAAERKQQGSKDVGILLIDKAHNMWAGTWGYGLSKIDAQTGQLIRYTSDERDPNALAGMQVQSIMEDSHGNIWVGSTSGLNRITPQGQIERIGAKESKTPLAHPRVWSVAETQDGNIWVATSLGIQQYKNGVGLGQPIQLFPSRTARDNEIRTLFRYGKDLWVGTRFGVWRFDPNTLQYHEVPFFTGSTAPIVNVITADAQGNLLVGTYNGMFRINPSTATYQSFRKNQALLPTVNVRAIFIDRSGVIWLGSRENGLYFARHSKSAFTSLRDLLPHIEPEQFRQTITAVLADEHTIWLGTSAGIIEIDRKQETLRRIATAGRVNALAKSIDQFIYIATDTGLFRIQCGESIQPIKEPFVNLPDVANNIRDLVIDQDGSFWLGLWGDGIVHWDPLTQKSTLYLKAQMQQKIGDAVQAIGVQQDAVWVGTRYSGLFRVDRMTGEARHVSDSTDLKLPSEDVQCAEPTTKGTILICTATGLVIYDPVQKTQRQLDKTTGLPSENILGAYQDAQENLWVMSSKGLTLQQAQNDRVITFTEQDGLIATELIFNAFYDDQQGFMYIGTIEGLTIVEPKYIWINDTEPKVAVSEVFVNNQPVEQKAVQGQINSLTLRPTDTNVEFNFAAFDFHDPTRNQFMHRLKGFEDHWVTNVGKHSAYYSNLPPGEYQLEMRGSNNHGLFSQIPLVVDVQVLPAWWQNHWIQAAIVLLSVLIGLAVHLYRLRHIQQINRLLQESVQQKAKAQLVLETKVAERTQALEESSLTLSLRTRQLEKSLAEVAKANRELKRLDQLKDEFISTVSHELRTPLTSIRGAMGLIAQKVVQPATASYDVLVSTALHNCERLGQLINDLLDVQKFESGQFNLAIKPIDLRELCEHTVTAMQSYALRYQVQVVVNCTEESDIWVEGDTLRLRQVLDNLLSNAVKFSHAQGVVTLSLVVFEHSVQLQVIDQGQGIPTVFQQRVFEKFSQADASDSRAKEGTGLGLTICKKIVESHGGRIWFESTEGQGTTFFVELQRSARPIDTE